MGAGPCRCGAGVPSSRPPYLGVFVAGELLGQLVEQGQDGYAHEAHYQHEVDGVPALTHAGAPGFVDRLAVGVGARGKVALHVAQRFCQMAETRQHPVVVGREGDQGPIVERLGHSARLSRMRDRTR